MPPDEPYRATCPEHRGLRASGAAVLRAALRDLQWRWKRFVIAVVGVALVFAMGLIMTGLSESFSLEVDRTLDGDRRRGVGGLGGRVRPVHVVCPDAGQHGRP